MCTLISPVQTRACVTVCAITYVGGAGNDGGYFLMDARPLCEKCSTVGHRASELAKYLESSGAWYQFLQLEHSHGGFVRLLVNHEVTQRNQNIFRKCELIGRFDPEEERQLQFVLPNGRCCVVDSGHCRVGADLYAQAFQIRKTSSEREEDNESTFLQTVAQTEKALWSQLDLYRWVGKCK